MRAAVTSVTKVHWLWKCDRESGSYYTLWMVRINVQSNLLKTEPHRQKKMFRYGQVSVLASITTQTQKIKVQCRTSALLRCPLSMFAPSLRNVFDSFKLPSIKIKLHSQQSLTHLPHKHGARVAAAVGIFLTTEKVSNFLLSLCSAFLNDFSMRVGNHFVLLRHAAESLSLKLE